MLSPLLPLLLALTPAPPPASPPVRVSPTLLDLDARQDDTELWLSNDGDQPWPAEVHLYRWQQHDDGERLTPATDLIASPSRFELPAGGRQRLRLVRLPAAGAAGEQAYRLLVEQRVQAGTTGQPRLRHSLPVFVHSGAPGTPAQIQAVVEGDRAQPLLSLYNPGQRHARVTWLAWIDAHGQRSVLLPGLAGYLLPGASRRWALPVREDGYRGGHFQARINDAPASPLAPLRLAADARP